MDRLLERYLKLVRGVDWRTPGYTVREEWKRDMMKIRAGKIAWVYEKKLKEGKGGAGGKEVLGGRNEKGRTSEKRRMVEGKIGV